MGGQELCQGTATYRWSVQGHRKNEGKHNFSYLYGVRMKKLVRQFTVYVIGGGLSAGLDVAIMLLMLKAGITALAALTLGFMSGLIFNYLFHANVTFMTASSRVSMFKYVSIVTLNYGLTLAIVWLAGLYGMSVLEGKIISLPIIAVVGYVFSRVWIFV